MHAVEHFLPRAALRRRHPHEVTEPPLPSSSIFEELQRTKARVPEMHDLIGRRSWGRLVDCNSKGPRRTRPLASRAYEKLREIIETCVLDSPTRSLHLCEAPGGFVQATADFASPGWQWKALSLHTPGAPLPAYDLLPLASGEFLTCDVNDAEAVAQLLAGDDPVDLVTADGAHNVCHERLEAEHHALLLAQTRAALSRLRRGGSLVIKCFEGAEMPTMLWLAWLTQSFALVSVLKPTGSRPTNSELYVVARDLQEPCDTPLDALSDIVVTAPWLRQVRGVLEQFSQKQILHLKAAFAQAEQIAHACTPSAPAAVGASQRRVADDGSHCTRAHSTR